MRRIFPVFVSLLCIFSGCKNDIDLLSDYKNIIVTYGLLDPADTVHYLRVEKAFLGPGNALVFSQNPDSIGFPIGTVDVKIEHWNNGQMIQTFQLYADTSIPRDSGIFQSPHQVLYRGAFPVLKDGSTYKLTVVDLVRGTTVSAETSIVQDMSMINPAGNFSPLNFADSTNFNFRYNTGNFGKRYSFKIRFHYTEQFIFDTTQTSEHYIDWSFGEEDAPSASGNELLTYNVRRNQFLDFCHQLIPANVYVRRISGKLDFIFLGASQDFATCIDVQTANNNAVIALPPYTNIVGGYGLFSSRTTTVLPGYRIDSNTQYALRVSPQTQGLNFVR